MAKAPRMSSPAESAEPSRLAFSYPAYRLFWLTSVAASFAAQIISVAVTWEVWLLTRDSIYLGFVGLAQFLPALSLVLVTGLAADRFSRRRIIQIAMVVELCCAISLVAFTLSQGHDVWPIFVILVIIGTARAFVGPAGSSLAPNLVPAPALSNAVAMNATAWQLAGILGPVAGGLLLTFSATVAFTVAGLLAAGAALAIGFIKAPVQHSANEKTSVGTLLAGFRYIWHEKVVLGAISLDLFAVLLGGAVALLPIFATDILMAGPTGLGLLRSAPGVGAIAMALWLARFPIRRNAGVILFWFVAAFGLATLGFGLSRSIWLSVPLLALMGACDMVSVSIRETIMQLWTPDDVRGRVNAVNSVFIGASNELGEFRAGMMAAFITAQAAASFGAGAVAVGAQAAVAFGGASTMAVAGIWSRVFPGLRKQDSLDRQMVPNESSPNRRAA
jgi:MFS family permease